MGKAATHFQDIVGGERCLATDPLAMGFVEIDGKAMVGGFEFEYRQRFESRPSTGQNRFQFSLLNWRESCEVGPGFVVVGHVRSSTGKFWPLTPTPAKRISCKE